MNDFVSVFIVTVFRRSVNTIVLRADIKPIVDGEAARCAASPSTIGPNLSAHCYVTKYCELCWGSEGDRFKL